jgi:hypothetical protein
LKSKINPIKINKKVPVEKMKVSSNFKNLVKDIQIHINDNQFKRINQPIVTDIITDIVKDVVNNQKDIEKALKKNNIII